MKTETETENRKVWETETETETENRKTETEKPKLIWFGLVFGFRLNLPTPNHNTPSVPKYKSTLTFLENPKKAK